MNLQCLLLNQDEWKSRNLWLSSYELQRTMRYFGFSKLSLGHYSFMTLCTGLTELHPVCWCQADCGSHLWTVLLGDLSEFPRCAFRRFKWISNSVVEETQPEKQANAEWKRSLLLRSHVKETKTKTKNKEHKYIQSCGTTAVNPAGLQTRQCASVSLVTVGKTGAPE